MEFPLRSVRARLTLWYSLSLCLPLVAFALFSYLSFSGALIGRTDAFLGDALTVFENELRVERRQFPAVEEALRVTVREVRFQDLDILVLDETGRIIASSVRTVGTPREGMEAAEHGSASHRVLEELREIRGSPDGISTLSLPGGGARVRLRPLTLGDSEFTVAGIYPLAEVEGTLRKIRHLFLVVIPILILLSGTGAWFLARHSFRPITAMASRAAEISATTLHERLPVVADDELGALVRVLNDLLDRLEASFLQQRRFVADASHELRSPAAILRSEADITLSRSHRTEAEYRESMAVIQDAARRLGKVVDDLFLLARVDGGQVVMSPEALYLEEVVRDTVRMVRPLAEQRGISVEIQDTVEASFRGDPDLLGRLLLNLLDNGIKHSPPGSRVLVSLTTRNDDYLIRVVDPGPGIDAGVGDRIFERFFQVDSARSRDGDTLTSGAGLGLAIGRSIAEMHGGRLELADSRPGRTEFLLTLPIPAGGPLPVGEEEWEVPSSGKPGM